MADGVEVGRACLNRWTSDQKMNPAKLSLYVLLVTKIALTERFLRLTGWMVSVAWGFKARSHGADRRD